MRSINWLPWLTGLYLVFLAAITALNYFGSDRFWLGALNLYLPQAMWAIPGIVLAVIYYRKMPSLTWLPLLCILWVLGPIMGFKLPLSTAKAASGNTHLRIMTWNIKYGYYPLERLQAEIAHYNPDVVFFQDASDSMRGPLKESFRDWNVRHAGQYVIASKYPLSEAENHDLPYFGWRKENFLRCRMYLGSQAVTLYNVHFKTPRWGLNGFRAARHRPGDLPEAIGHFNHNVRTRFLQALAIDGYLGSEPGQVIVAGDLNSPDASVVCRTLRDAGLHDAFAERGTGYGFTYGQLLLKRRLPWLRLSWMRIDHIMLSPAFITERCWTGTGLASDHRPVIADVTLASN